MLKVGVAPNIGLVLLRRGRLLLQGVREASRSKISSDPHFGDKLEAMVCFIAPRGT